METVGPACQQLNEHPAAARPFSGTPHGHIDPWRTQEHRRMPGVLLNTEARHETVCAASGVSQPGYRPAPARCLCVHDPQAKSDLTYLKGWGKNQNKYTTLLRCVKRTWNAKLHPTWSFVGSQQRPFICVPLVAVPVPLGQSWGVVTGPLWPQTLK